MIIDIIRNSNTNYNLKQECNGFVYPYNILRNLKDMQRYTKRNFD